MANTQEPHSKIYKTQGATALVVSSGAEIQFTSGSELNFGIGSSLNLTSGKVSFPGNLARGYESLRALGFKATATASGMTNVFTTATQPSIHCDETSGQVVYRWTSAALESARLYFHPIRLPDDFSTAAPLRVHVNARASGAATHNFNVGVWQGTATANLGSTMTLTSAVIERTVSVASGSLLSSGQIQVACWPTSVATGPWNLWSVGISYAKKTS